MKLIIFLVSALLVGSSSAQTAAQNASIEVRNILNEFDTSLDQLRSQISIELCNGITVLRNLLIAGWNALKFIVSFATSPSYITILDNAVNTAVETLVSDCNNAAARNASYQVYQAVREIYRDAVERYIYYFNTTSSSGVYQCWNATRPQVREVLRNFVNTTRTQSKPFIDQANNVTSRELQTLISNFTFYQFNVPFCGSFFFSRIRACRDAYVSF